MEQPFVLMVGQCCTTSIVKCYFLCPSGDVFIGSIDITREYKDAHKICNALAEYIETIGVNNVVQICIDNVSSMRNVPNLLICHFPILYFQVCDVHCLNLLLEDWGKTTQAKQIMKKKKTIVSFIQQHHAPLATFCCYETNLMLNPIETWCATNFLMVERLFKLRPTIEQTIADPNSITSFVNLLHGNHRKKKFSPR
jgi:hypothetical protein